MNRQELIDLLLFTTIVEYDSNWYKVDYVDIDNSRVELSDYDDNDKLSLSFKTLLDSKFNLLRVESIYNNYDNGDNRTIVR